MYIKRFNETKSKEDEVTSVDIKSFEDDKDVIGFVRNNDELTDAAEKKLKKEIQNDGGTPGLKTAIKKFEDFSVKITIDEDGEASVETGEGDNCAEECCQECGCEPCECQGDLEPSVVCDACNCEPCECEQEVVPNNNVVPFADFLKGIL